MSLTFPPSLRRTFSKRRLLIVVAVSLLVACNRGPSAEECFQRAAALNESGDLQAAIIELKNALKKAPKMVEARLLLGRIYVRFGFGREAEKELNRALELGSKDTTALYEAWRLEHKYQEILDHLSRGKAGTGAADASAYRGVALAGLRHYAKAESSYRRVLEQDPGNAIARHGLTRLMVFRGQLDAAQEQITLSLKSDPDDLEAYLLSGQISVRRKDYKQAAKAYRRSLELAMAHSTSLTRNQRRARIGLARVLLVEQQPDAAEKQVQAVAAEYPKSLTVNHLLGVVAMQRGDVEGAKKFARTALNASPNYPNALLLLASLEFKSGNLNQAQELARRLVANFPRYVTGRKLLAETQIKLGEPREAIQTLLPLAKRAVNDATVHALLGSAYFALRDYSAATAEYQNAARLKSSRKEAIQTDLALSYLAAGSPDKAVPILETVSSQSPSFAGADYILAMTYLNQGKPAQAREWARQVVKKQPKNPVPLNVIGASYRAEKKIEKARHYFLKALEVDPGYVTAAMNLASLALGDGDKAEARSRYNQVLSKHPDNSAALLALARLDQQENKPLKAIKALKRAREVDAAALEPRLVLVGYYLRRGRVGEALKSASEAYGLAPENPRVLIALGTSQLAANRPQEALVSFRRLQEIQPKKPDASYNLAVAYARLGRLDEARAALRRALRLAPDHVLANIALGRIEIRTGHAELARPIADRLIKLLPKSGAGYGLRGDALLAQKNARAAIIAFATAFEREPSSQLARRLYTARRVAGKAAAAERGLLAWVKEHPNDSASYTLLGNTFQKDGRDKDAIDAYEQAVRVAPRNAVALNNLANLYHQRNDPRTLATAKRAFELLPNSPEVLDTYGWILAQGDSAEKGLKLLRKAAAKMGGDPAVRYHLAAALAKVGNTKEAKRELQALLDPKTDFPEKLQASTLLQQLQLLP